MNKYSYASSEKIVDMVKSKALEMIDKTTKLPAGWERIVYEVGGICTLAEAIVDELTREEESDEQ